MKLTAVLCDLSEFPVAPTCIFQRYLPIDSLANLVRSFCHWSPSWILNANAAKNLGMRLPGSCLRV